MKELSCESKNWEQDELLEPLTSNETVLIATRQPGADISLENKGIDNEEEERKRFLTKKNESSTQLGL